MPKRRRSGHKRPPRRRVPSRPQAAGSPQPVSPSPGARAVPAATEGEGAPHAHNERTTKLSDTAAALAVSLAALAVYAVTLAPTVTSEDSGELIAAAATAGVAHPPGYPLWTLCGWLFACLPGLSAAQGVNLMSACFGALTVGLTFLAARALSLSAWSAAFGALCLAFSLHFWSVSIVAEVYTLNAALFAGMLLLLLRWAAPEVASPDAARARPTRLLIAAAAVFGVSLANHYMLSLLVTPALVLYVLFKEPGLLRSGRTLALAAAVACSGLVLYAYLPLAARGHPLVNWGDPSNWERLWAHVTRASYRSLEFGQAPTLEDRLGFFSHFGGMLLEQFTPGLLVLFAPLGLSALRRVRGAHWLLLGVIVLDSFVLLLILRFRFTPDNRNRVQEYYLPAYLCVSLFMAAGLDAVLRRFHGSAAWLRFVAPLAALAPLLTHFRVNDYSNYYLAYDYNRTILGSLAPNAVYYTCGDYTSFPTAYLQAVESRRRDVLHAGLTGKPSPELVAYARSVDPTVDPQSSSGLFDAVLQGSRPLYVASRSELKGRSRRRVTPAGLVYRVTPQRVEPPPAPDVFTPPPLRNLELSTTIDDLGRNILFDYHVMRAEALATQGQRSDAERAFADAAEYASDNKEAYNNLGSACAERGFFELAARYLRAAAGLDLEYVTARRNLAGLLDRLGRTDEARSVWRDVARLDPKDEGARSRVREGLDQALRGPERPASRPVDPRREAELAQLRVERFRKATEESPKNPAVWNDLGAAYAEAGEPALARAALDKAVALDPDHATAHKNLATLYRSELHDEVSARRHEREAERIERSNMSTQDDPDKALPWLE